MSPRHRRARTVYRIYDEEEFFAAGRDAAEKMAEPAPGSAGHAPAPSRPGAYAPAPSRSAAYAPAPSRPGAMASSAMVSPGRTRVAPRLALFVGVGVGVASALIFSVGVTHLTGQVRRAQAAVPARGALAAAPQRPGLAGARSHLRSIAVARRRSLSEVSAVVASAPVGLTPRSRSADARRVAPGILRRRSARVPGRRLGNGGAEPTVLAGGGGWVGDAAPVRVQAPARAPGGATSITLAARVSPPASSSRPPAAVLGREFGFER